MLENARYQVNIYEKVLVSLCKKDPNNRNAHYNVFRNKLNGVLDMLTYDKSLSADEYSKVWYELTTHFDEVYKNIK